MTWRVKLTTIRGGHITVSVITAPSSIAATIRAAEYRHVSFDDIARSEVTLLTDERETA